ncbi:MAG: hypothetical protein K1X57_16505 [Gemmataceae bacterium]|nr:hypothetical protein [Gemmataceae bacterium]
MTPTRPATDSSLPPAGLGPARSTELFPGYTGAREIFRGTFTGSPRGSSETVVLRILPARHFADPRAHHRYGTNLDRASHLRVPGVAPVFGRGTTSDGRAFQARAHVTGVPIDVYNRGEAFGLAKPPELGLVLERLVAAARAVHRAHLAGVLHGGIKSTNILTHSDGTTNVLDFGLNLPAVGEVADDVAALGRLTFELIRQRQEPLNPELIAIAARATAADPRRTFGTAGALADALDNYLHGRSSAAPESFLNDSLGAWTARHIARPRWLPAVAAVTGWLAGLAISIVAFGSPAWSVAFLTLAALAALGGGALACQLAGVRTRAGVWLAGSLVGLMAGLFAWGAGAGATVSATVAESALAGPNKMLDAWPKRPAFTVSKHDIPANHPQDRLVEKFPQLSDVPEDQRPAALAEIWRGRVRSAAALAGQVGFVVPVCLGLLLTLLSAHAWKSCREGSGYLPDRAVSYFELSLPGQLAGLLTAALLVEWAAGRPAHDTWPAVVGLIALAVGTRGLIRGGVPTTTRLVCYLAGVTLLCRLSGHALPVWGEWPAYLAAAFLCYRYTLSFRAPKYPPAD